MILLKSSLCDYSDSYILVKVNISANNTAAEGNTEGANANNINEKIIFKNSAPFTNYISEINNAQVDNATDIDTVTPMYSIWKLKVIL